MNSKYFAFLCALSLSNSIAWAEAQSASEAYMDLHKKELLASSYEDLVALRSKESVSHDTNVSPEEKKMLFPLFKDMTPKEIVITKETVDGDKATLLVTSPGKPPDSNGLVETTTGTVTLQMEDGKWKLYKEKWDSKTESAPASATPAK